MKKNKALYNKTANSEESADTPAPQHAAKHAAQADGNGRSRFHFDFSDAGWKYLPPLAAYLLITLIVFWPVALHMTTTVAAGRPGAPTVGSSDFYQNIWSMWWVDYAIFKLHSSPYFTNMLFYPNGANLVTETLSPLAGLFTLPIHGMGLPFAFNVLLIIDFTLSGFFMFLLADHLIRNRYAAFISGIVFAFSAFHMAHAMVGQTNWIGIEFLPLFVLFVLLIIRDKNLFSILGTSVSFLLLVFYGDSEQGIIGIVFIVLMLLLKLLNSKDRSDILSRRFIVSVFSSVVLVLVIGSPFFVPIVHGIMHGALGLASGSSSLGNSMAWSSPLLSFFLPGPSNNIFMSVANAYSKVYSADTVERVSYIGWIAILLILIAIFKGVRKDRSREIIMWTVLGLVFIWLATGPYLQIGALPSQANISSYLPGIYLVYRSMPILNLVREPGRFNLIVTLCVAILAGFGFNELVSVLKGRDSGNKGHTYILLALLVIVTVLILVESVGIPVTGKYISSYFLHPEIPGGYSQIANASGNFSVVILPILSSYTTVPNLYTGEAMYYQTAFQKPMVGGYTSRENATDQYIRLNMPLSVEAASLQSGGLFAYASPINENYTNLTMFFLSKYNVRYVSVINSAYNFTDLLVLDNYLDATFGSPVYKGNSTGIWLANSTVKKAAGRSVVSYISLGNWTYGCASLGTVHCNSTMDRLWYGPSLRAINVSVPSNETDLYMTFSAASLNSNVTLYVFQTSDKHELGAANLTRSVVNYGLNLTVGQGTTSLFFVATNSIGGYANHTYDLGIGNITFVGR
ncbi:MAG: hypothetical protein ACREBH_00285 [Candidatus Micrarchaeaceae archaeon]